MDEFMILEFIDGAAAQACLDSVNAAYAARLAAQHYTVIETDGETQIIGKNAATGLDQPDAACTDSWDELYDSPDGTFYFTRPAMSADIAAALSGFSFTERALPQEWRAAP